MRLGGFQKEAIPRLPPLRSFFGRFHQTPESSVEGAIGAVSSVVQGQLPESSAVGTAVQGGKFPRDGNDGKIARPSVGPQVPLTSSFLDLPSPHDSPPANARSRV